MKRFAGRRRLLGILALPSLVIAGALVAAPAVTTTTAASMPSS